jgi:hypothetical protein
LHNFAVVVDTFLQVMMPDSLKLKGSKTLCVCKVVGSIEQTGMADAIKVEGDLESSSDAKMNVKLDSEKSKSKRKLYVGSQALGYRRDFMEVCTVPFDMVNP